MSEQAVCTRCRQTVENLDIQEDGTCWYCEPDEDKQRAHGNWLFGRGDGTDE